MQNMFDLQDNMEIKCENFKPRKQGQQILVKNLHLNPIRDRKYTVFRGKKEDEP